MTRSRLFLAGACLLATFGTASAGGFFTNGLPPAGGTQYPTTIPLTGNETIPADTNLPSGLAPQSESLTVTQLQAGDFSSYGSVAFRNALIGGDFGTNLWQRGTAASANISNTLTYYADGWWNLGGASSSVNVTKETGAADITTAYLASARFQRTAANTDTAQICTGQVLTTANSARFQGKVVEFSAHMLTGGNFSAANSQVTMTIGYGTGTDQSAANFAAGSWTSYVAAVAQPTTISSTWTRYSAVANIPLTATQVGVKICFTPVGTAGATDWFEFTGAQLDANPGADNFDGTPNSSFSIAAFERLPQSIEALREYAYFYRFAEPASGAAVNGICQATGANTNACTANLPVVMRAVPTLTITTAGTFKVNIAGTVTTIATPTASTCSASSCAVTAANTNTAGQAELLTGGGGTGKWDVSAEL